MPSPFPGMDPYLEEPSGWHPFHTKLVAALADSLNSSLPDGYYAEIEHRRVAPVWEDKLFVAQPDALVVGPGSTATATLTPARSPSKMGLDILPISNEPMKERYLEIRTQGEPQNVVAVVEVLSYSNKLGGRDRDRYLQKRGQIVVSRTSLIEIDLLHTGARMPGWDEDLPYHYGVIAGPGYRRPHAKLFGFTVQEEAVSFSLPLDGVANEPEVNLQDLLVDLYARGRYSMRIDYSRKPHPPLAAEDEAWADTLLRERGLR
jgi:hypothetical protein